MHIHFDLMTLNWLAIVLATASAFVLGGIWYGPIFGKQWMAEFGFNEEEIAKRHPAKIFGAAILLTFIAAVFLALIIGHDSNYHYGALWGFMIGFGPVAMFIGVHYVFEQRSLKLFFINMLYPALSLVIMGAIIGAMA